VALTQLRQKLSAGPLRENIVLVRGLLGPLGLIFNNDGKNFIVFQKTFLVFIKNNHDFHQTSKKTYYKMYISQFTVQTKVLFTLFFEKMKEYM